MATNNIFQADDRVTFAYAVPAGTKAGDFVMLPNDTPGVAVTSRGDAETTEVLGNLGITVTFPSGGQSLASDEATVATTGTWDLPVDGITASAAPAQGDKIYWDAGDKKLTTSASGNSYAGFVNAPAEGYAWRDGIAPVRIGAPN